MASMRKIPTVAELVEIGDVQGEGTIDDCCKAVQDALGVTDGGLASTMLKDDDFTSESWNELFLEYIKAERKGVAAELKCEDLRDALAESAELLARAKRLDDGVSLFRVKVRRVVVMTAEIEVEASDEDAAGDLAVEQAQFGSVDWDTECSNDSDFEVSDVEEIN